MLEAPTLYLNVAPWCNLALHRAHTAAAAAAAAEVCAAVNSCSQEAAPVWRASHVCQQHRCQQHSRAGVKQHPGPVVTRLARPRAADPSAAR
jgi:hypothetical protein